MYRSKMVAKEKKEFMFPQNGHVTKTWKTLFKEFFNTNWLKIREHEYIYISEIKFEQNVSVWKLWPKQFL